MRIARIVPVLPRTRSLITSPLGLRFVNRSSDVATLPASAVINDLTKLTVIVGYTRRFAHFNALVAKRAGLANAQIAGWSAAVNQTGTYNFVWGRATAGTNYTSTDTPGVILNTPLWLVATADQSAAANNLIKFYGGRLGERVLALANTTTTDGSGAYSSDASNAFALGNSVTPTANDGMEGELWRVLVFDRVLSTDQINQIVMAPWDRTPGALVDLFPGDSQFGAQDWGKTHGRLTLTAAYPVNGPRFLAPTLVAKASPVLTSKRRFLSPLTLSVSLPQLPSRIYRRPWRRPVRVASGPVRKGSTSATTSQSPQNRRASAGALMRRRPIPRRRRPAPIAFRPVRKGIAAAPPTNRNRQFLFSSLTPLTTNPKPRRRLTRARIAAIPVYQPAGMVLNPTSIIFVATVNTFPPPLPRQVHITNAGEKGFTLSIGTITGSWLAASLAANSLVTLTPSIGGLGVGTYTGSVQVLDATAAPVTIQAKLILTGVGQYLAPTAEPPAGWTWDAVNGVMVNTNPPPPIPTRFLAGGAAPVRWIGSGAPVGATVYSMTTAGAQLAISDMHRGDVIVVESKHVTGATVSVTTVQPNPVDPPFVLPALAAGATGADTDYVCIMSSDIYNGIFPVPYTGRVMPYQDPTILNHFGVLSFDYTGAQVQAVNQFFQIVADFNCSYIRLCGLEIRSTPDHFGAGANNNRLADIVAIGASSSTLASQVPHHIWFDRCYVHGSVYPPYSPCKNGVNCHGDFIYNIGSDIGEVSVFGQESHAWIGFNCNGPWHMENFHVHDSSINWMIGGAKPALGAPHFPRDVALIDWLSTRDGATKGSPNVVTVKNNGELKFGERVLWDGFVLDGMWDGGQSYALTMKTTVQLGQFYPWVQSKDVFVNNGIIQNASAGIAVNGRTENAVLISANHEFRNILIKPLDTGVFFTAGTSSGLVYQIGGPFDGLVFRHCTGFPSWDNTTGITSYSIFFNGDNAPRNLLRSPPSITGFVFEDNITGKQPSTAGPGSAPYWLVNDGGWPAGAGNHTARAALDLHAGAGLYVWRGVLATGVEGAPPGTLYPQNVASSYVTGNKYTTAGTSGGVLLQRGDIGFSLDTNPNVYGDWTLQPFSPAVGAASDGRDMGVMWPLLTARTARALSGAAIGGAVLPAIGLVPSTLNFTAVAGGSSPLSRIVNIVNTGGGGTLAPSLGPSTAAWLTATLLAGVVTVTATLGTLAASPIPYTGTIQVNDPTASNSPQFITASFLVTPAPPILVVTPSTPLLFIAIEGGTNPAAQILALSNTGGGTLAPSIGASSAPWLSATIVGTTVRVVASVAGLPAAAVPYPGSFTILDPLATNSPVTVSANFLVTPPVVVPPPAPPSGGTVAPGRIGPHLITDVISIWNMALSFCGNADEVQDQAENSANANACRRFYEQDLAEMLNDFEWPFAKVTRNLALVEVQPTTEWGFAYRYPIDCLTLRRILGSRRNETRQSRVPYLMGQDDNGSLIYTDMANAVAEYTVVVLDASQFSPSFAKALSLKLAIDIAPRVTGGDPAALQQKLLVRYKAQLEEAQGNALNEEQVEEAPDSEFMRARDGSWIDWRFPDWPIR